MRLVIADTSPINYLMLIGHIDLLPSLFNRVILPAVVRDELSHPKAPLVVRTWLADPPDWVDIRQHPASLSNGGTLSGITYSASFEAAPSVPEPASMLLMGLGLVGAGLTARRKVVAQ